MAEVGVQVLASSFSPDGRLLAVTRMAVGNDSDIYLYSMDNGTFEPLIKTP